MSILKWLKGLIPNYDPWDCKCHERRWGAPWFMDHIDGPGWFTTCLVCYDSRRLAPTKKEAERLLREHTCFIER